MKALLENLLQNAVSMFLAVLSFVLCLAGSDHWGWFLFLAVLSYRVRR